MGRPFKPVQLKHVACYNSSNIISDQFVQKQLRDKRNSLLLFLICLP